MPSGDRAPHQTNAASRWIGLDFIPGTTSPVGNTMLAVASPSSKSLADVWRKDRVIAAVAVANVATISSGMVRARAARMQGPLL